MRTSAGNLVGVSIVAAFLGACGGGSGGVSSSMPATDAPACKGEQRGSPRAVFSRN
jgi:hypothetical protein